ncbi:BREX-2 system phosphatase PglZ [Actinomadura decatromicini]|uniref:BREX-2 system phosphatase PglZ n=1 Tax=Actinomadura decatromicini TaxID=2604572 RepID=A0A5D3F6U7_9ACTN|nr:BREX-2 system phosphatase PglZ [Actinomadura decatromicini]TYK43420.1 BREX-2 system phosphatase PglZ [Actinomadura decatromicini]
MTESSVPGIAGAAAPGRRAVPVATSGILIAEVRRARRRSPEGGTLFLRAAAEWRGGDVLDLDGATVQVAPCTTLLGVLDAVSAKRTDFLVVLSAFERRELGESLLAHAIGHDIVAVNRWDLVRHAFGAKRLDPRLTAAENAWLSDALLEAQPDGGWPKIKGAMLDYDTALAAVTSARLGADERPGHPLDVAGLLDWAEDIAAVSRFTGLAEREQQGIAAWLARSVGPVADVLFRLVRAGHASDAVAAGLVAGVLFGRRERRQAVVAARVRAERLFGGAPLEEPLLTAYAEACESLLLRRMDGDAMRARIDLQRAQDLLDELQVGNLAGASRILGAGYQLRLRTLVETVSSAVPDPLRAEVREVDAALGDLMDHRLHRSRPETRVAEMAARLVRWLARDPEPAESLREHVDRYVRDGSWVDRAVTEVRDSGEERYAGLLAAVRARRDVADEEFAERLAAWSSVSGTASELVLVENLMDVIARPVAARAAPLIIVVDGMTTAIAGAVTTEITEGGRWTETGRHAQGREGALATVPSITAFSRTSLLCGELRAGQQVEEQRGFRDFWGTRPTALFHKADVRDGLSEEVTAAVADRGTVVGVVLNAVDDSLDKGRADGRADWHAGGIAGLDRLLDAAWRAGRPVVLTSDHGHVLDRGDASITVRAEAARHRTGEPQEGEVAVTGSRVLAPGGAVVVPWNERVRYNSRKGGYHGGVSLAEMVVPVAVLVPSERLIPEGWEIYGPAMHEPVWWTRFTTTPDREAGTAGAAARERAEEPLFEMPSSDGLPGRGKAEGIGTRVVASGLFRAQREQFARVPVDDRGLIALIDALAAAGGKLPLPVAAQRAGQLPARMHGYVSTVAKLLNVDGYQVLAVTDGGRTVALDVPLLREQFLGGGR